MGRLTIRPRREDSTHASMSGSPYISFVSPPRDNNPHLRRWIPLLLTPSPHHWPLILSQRGPRDEEIHKRDATRFPCPVSSGQNQISLPRSVERDYDTKEHHLPRLLEISASGFFVCSENSRTTLSLSATKSRARRDAPFLRSSARATSYSALT